jgi:toxin-antitoxin system PIN domain toxin
VRICLPDVNVLIALHDPAHQDHDKAHEWFTTEGQQGWATCPLTENGFVRVLSQPNYCNNVGSPSVALHILENMVSAYAKSHQFWHDSPSLRDGTLFHSSYIIGPKQITDIYLLGLCQQNGGSLITFDTRVNIAPIVAPHSNILRIL